MKKHDISPNHIRQLINGGIIDDEPKEKMEIARKQSRNDLITLLLGTLSKSPQSKIQSHLEIKFTDEEAQDVGGITNFFSIVEEYLKQLSSMFGVKQM